MIKEYVALFNAEGNSNTQSLKSLEQVQIPDCPDFSLLVLPHDW